MTLGSSCASSDGSAERDCGAAFDAYFLDSQAAVRESSGLVRRLHGSETEWVEACS